jgi:hypothetical protein
MYKRTLSIVFGLGALLYCGQLFAETTNPPANDQSDSDKVYKSVGPGGETIYSDKPSPDSEEMTLPKNGTYKPVKPPGDFTPYRPERKKPSKSIANSVNITSPQDKQTIWSGTGELPVSVSLDKGLGPGQKLEYQIDGKTVLSGTQTSHTFQNIFRGEHVIVVRLVDPSGNTLTSKPVTVYMRRPSVQNPYHPQNRPVPKSTAPH